MAARVYGCVVNGFYTSQQVIFDAQSRWFKQTMVIRSIAKLCLKPPSLKSTLHNQFSMSVLPNLDEHGSRWRERAAVAANRSCWALAVVSAYLDSSTVQFGRLGLSFVSPVEVIIHAFLPGWSHLLASRTSLSTKVPCVFPCSKPQNYNKKRLSHFPIPFQQHILLKVDCDWPGRGSELWVGSPSHPEAWALDPIRWE